MLSKDRKIKQEDAKENLQHNIKKKKRRRKSGGGGEGCFEMRLLLGVYKGSKVF